MRPEERDVSYLLDMLDSARSALEFTRDVSLADSSRNAMLHLAVERAIQIIGEAANRVSPAFQQAHPEIPRRRIVAQRNVLVHEYGDVEHSLIWDLVQRYLPSRVDQLEPLIPSPPQDPQDS
jgi:uncharacterized protein with HEPN domain